MYINSHIPDILFIVRKNKQTFHYFANEDFFFFFRKEKVKKHSIIIQGKQLELFM